MILDRRVNMKYKLGNEHFWSEGYYVSTVGLNEAATAKDVNCTIFAKNMVVFAKQKKLKNWFDIMSAKGRDNYE